MRRKLFNLATGVWLLPCCGLALAWAWSVRVADSFVYDGRRWSFSIISANGRLRAMCWDEASTRAPLGSPPLPPLTPATGWHHGQWYPELRHARLYDERTNGDVVRVSAMGFTYWHGEPWTGGTLAIAGATGWSTRNWGVIIPYWAILAATLSIPALRIVANERRRHCRLAIGLCPTCGYDCRATPEAAREGEALLQTCPECGTELARSKPRPPT